MNLHWNYYLALDNDMARVSRFIEFCPANLNVFSLELAHLLFAASSEVDVIAKSLCDVLGIHLPSNNINEYRNALMPVIPDLSDEEITVPRFGLSFKPWEDWSRGVNPSWWRSYNNVKHERNNYFHEATLENALNSLAGLLIITLYYFKESRNIAEPGITFKDVTLNLGLNQTLLCCDEDYFCAVLVDG